MPLDFLNFIKTINDNDKVFHIIKDGKIIRSIDPFAIENFHVQTNIIRLNMAGNKLIVLDFYNHIQAREALKSLSDIITELKSRVPLNIDKRVENYIEDKLYKAGGKHGVGRK
jgi:hypothetical protein